MTTEPGPISPQACVDRSVEITGRAYITCPEARRALARYLVGSELDERQLLGQAPFLSCNGDLATGGYCAVTFPTGAQGRFAYGPTSRGIRPPT